MSGLFISFEGIEGVGKTTLIVGLSEFLAEQGHRVILTREPGGTPLAERLREQLLHRGDEAIAPDCELLLMFAARSQHLSQLILPALGAGNVVLCDRFVDSSYAYQCQGRGVARHKLDVLVEQFVPRMPDLTLWLDLPLEQARMRLQARAQQQGQALDRFEQERQDFFERVRSGFEMQAQISPQRIVRLDASLPAEQVLVQAISVFTTRLT